MLLSFKQKEAVSPVKREAAFLQSTHVAFLSNIPCHPEPSEGTEVEGGKNSQSVLMRSLAAGPSLRSK